MSIKEQLEMNIERNIERVYQEKGYKFFTGDMSVNVFGVRCQTNTNKFDDVMGVAWYEKGEFKCETYEATTDPGSHWLVNLYNPGGCAILVEGQYRGAYKLGLHRGKYLAGVQRGGKVKCYRDKNKDTIHDMKVESITEGYYGINLHAGNNSRLVGANSAGCQVIKWVTEFEKFVSIIKKSTDKYGDEFSYTLLNSKDF